MTTTASITVMLMINVGSPLPSKSNAHTPLVPLSANLLLQEHQRQRQSSPAAHTVPPQVIPGDVTFSEEGEGGTRRGGRKRLPPQQEEQVEEGQQGEREDSKEGSCKQTLRDPEHRDMAATTMRVFISATEPQPKKNNSSKDREQETSRQTKQGQRSCKQKSGIEQHIDNSTHQTNTWLCCRSRSGPR